MECVVNLIDHLLQTKHSIDTIDSIVWNLRTSREELVRLINNDRYQDFFQLLRPLDGNKNAEEKLALTLNLFYCKHYASGCKNVSCLYIHLCPFDVYSNQVGCIEKNCKYDHDILQNEHNKKIINAQQLSFIHSRVLHNLLQASADPIRSFWICQAFGKKASCMNGIFCNKLHFCYYFLTDTCTKRNCQHVINDACRAYFRQKQLDEQNQEDIFAAIKKVLRQRHDISSTTTPVSNKLISNPSNYDKCERKRSAHSKNRKSNSTKPAISVENVRSHFDDVVSTSPDIKSPLPTDEQDITLDDTTSRNYDEIKRALSYKIGCPIKLLAQKSIKSAHKIRIQSNISVNPCYYYCPSNSSADFFQILQWQNESKRTIKPLTVFKTITDAHSAVRKNSENDPFCILRVRSVSGTANAKSSENSLQLYDPSTVCFDCMWIYTYDI